MKACIRGLSHYLPAIEIDNDALSTTDPAWTSQKLAEKTGIRVRHIAGDEECASDLAFGAATQLLSLNLVSPEQIDLLVLCTQSPDYFLPTTACTLQARLGLSRRCAAFDFNLGCSGYIYGLGIVKGMLETAQASHALLLTAETYSKFMRHDDLRVRTIFADEASATLLSAEERCDSGYPYGFAFGTDGRGAEKLIVRAGGMRLRSEARRDTDADHLYMDGPEIFAFTLREVPETVSRVLAAAGLKLADIDLFVFHQANGFMLEHLRKKLGVPASKYVICLREYGNTVSATIPIALESSVKDGILQAGMKVMLVGFGVGYSWAGCLVNWPEGVATA